MDCSYEGTCSLYLDTTRSARASQVSCVTWQVSCTESGTSSRRPETRGVPGREVCTRRLSQGAGGEGGAPASSSSASEWSRPASDTSRKPPR